MKEQKKQGLIVVYDPHNLLEFLWYYATHGKEYEWTALCLPNGYKGEYMGDYCERCGIFKRIIRKKEEFLSASAGRKAVIFLDMLANAVVGRQEALIRRFLKDYDVDVDAFDRLVVMTDVGLISGMVVSLGKHKDVVIMEDGTGDYYERTYSQIRHHLNKSDMWQGMLVSAMGYSNPGHFFPLRTTRYAVKYCSKISQMKYRNYREMRQLFDFEKTDMELYNELIRRAYGDFDVNRLKESDIVFFTVPLVDYLEDTENHVSRIVGYVNGLVAEGKRRVVVKRHPRDPQTYRFSEEAEVYEIDNSIPSEVLLPYVKDKTLVFFDACSTLLNIKDESDIVMLYMKDLLDCKGYKFGKYHTKDEIESYMRDLGLTRYEMVDI